jgi:CsoR family transcriptional regulator, copper-sensing transcriptional repressor
MTDKHNHAPSNLNQTDLAKRLSKVRGQIEGISKMIDRDEHCLDLIHQCRAVKGAISRIEEMILEAHLKTCLVDAVQNGNALRAIDEVLDIYRASPNR